MYTPKQPETTQITVPYEIVSLIFDKQSGTLTSSNQCNISNYDITITVPSKYKGYVNVHGYYPDIDHAPRIIQAHVDKVTSELERREIIVGEKLLLSLRTKYFEQMKVISKLYQTRIHFSINSLILISLGGEIEQAFLHIKTLQKEMQDEERSHYQEQKRRDALYNDQMISQPWFAKDIRRPAHNVI